MFGVRIGEDHESQVMIIMTKVDQVIEILVPMVASMAFGGKNIKKLFVTTRPG